MSFWSAFYGYLLAPVSLAWQLRGSPVMYIASLTLGGHAIKNCRRDTTSGNLDIAIILLVLLSSRNCCIDNYGVATL